MSLKKRVKNLEKILVLMKDLHIPSKTKSVHDNAFINMKSCNYEEVQKQVRNHIADVSYL